MFTVVPVSHYDEEPGGSLEDSLHLRRGWMGRWRSIAQLSVVEKKRRLGADEPAEACLYFEQDRTTRADPVSCTGNQ
jgi:hypothetical protein